MRKLGRAVAIVLIRNSAWLVLLLITACTGVALGPSVAPSCPNVSVITDTSVVTKFQPGLGHDLTDIIFRAQIVDYEGFCDTDVEEGGGGEVEVMMRLSIEIELGPANTEGGGIFEYFVAIGDQDANLLAKEQFTTEFVFKGKVNRMTTIEDPIQFSNIPLKPGQFGEDFTIYVGFQLSKDELLYNRRQNLH